MNSSVYVGLAVTANNDSSLTTAVIDNMSIVSNSPSPTPTPLPTNDFIIINSTLPGYEAIYKADLGGMNWQQLAGDGSGSWKHAGYPRVSPDGQWVAYEAHNGSRYLWIVGIDGNNKQQLFSSPIHHARIVWAPDSSQNLIHRRRQYCKNG